jgi:release factor glutamine methyltransferase
VKKTEILDLIEKDLFEVIGENAFSEAERILMDILGFDSRAELYINDYEINQEILSKINNVVSLRKKRVPLQYILGYSYFYDLKFYLDYGVFIPRQETELLVDYVIENFKNKFLRILEIGTGCGNISICLTKYMGNCRIVATDILDKALKKARYNACYHQVGENIQFVKAKGFSFLKGKEFFDLILSNPPYIKNDDLNILDKELSFEPEEALKGGKNGCDVIFELIDNAFYFLKEKGELILEIGYDEKDLIVEFLNKKWRNIDYKFIKDFQGIDRILILKKNG